MIWLLHVMEEPVIQKFILVFWELIQMDNIFKAVVINQLIRHSNVEVQDLLGSIDIHKYLECI
jgi:hypothetical protein